MEYIIFFTALALLSWIVALNLSDIPLNKINDQHKTRFCINHHIQSKMFFGFYRKKIYFHNIKGVSKCLSYKKIKHWEMTESDNKNIWGMLTITTQDESLPLIRLPYQTQANAQADLDKLEALMQRMRLKTGH